MQEEVTQKTIALYVKVGKGAARLTEQALQKAIQKFLEQKSKPAHGKQTMRQLMIGNRSRFEAGDPSGYWLDMPATKEQLHEAMQSVGITADNPQDFSIRGYSDDPEKHIALPYDMVCAASVDELNFLAARIEQLDPAEIGKLNAALQQKNGFENIGQVIDFTYNVDFYVHIPEVHTYRDLGDYYLPLISSRTAGTPGQLFTQGKSSEKYRAAKQV